MNIKTIDIFKVDRLEKQNKINSEKCKTIENAISAITTLLDSEELGE